MRSARDLLITMMFLALAAEAVPRAPPSVGSPAPAPPCPVVVELDGAVACLSEEAAAHAGARAGDRIDGQHRGRMSPAALAAWQVPVDVNRASLEELASLDGVGPRLAERIAAARPFRSVDEVGRIRGIGRHRFERLRNRLTIALDE